MSEVLEPLEQWEVKQVVVDLEAVPVVEMVVVGEVLLKGLLEFFGDVV